MKHRTLRATVQWSYDLLSLRQQAVFARLAVFTGPFDLPAAEAVAAAAEVDTVEVDRLVGDLVERSMVTVESGPSGRFRLLETCGSSPARTRSTASHVWPSCCPTCGLASTGRARPGTGPRRHGHADHPVVRFTHAYLYDDDAEDRYASPVAAVVWLRERGEDRAANLVEVAGVAAQLMTSGRFTELDTLAATMQDISGGRDDEAFGRRGRRSP